MKRFGMSIGPSCLLLAVCANHSYDSAAWILSLIGVSVGWLATELFIAFGRSFKNQVPKRWWILASRLGWVLAVCFARLDHHYGWISLALFEVLALWFTLAMWIGLALRVTAITHLGTRFRYDLRILSEQPLHTRGVYSLIRHPSYLGLILLATTPGLVMGSIVGFILLAICTIPQILYRIQMEERILIEHYGQAYLDYIKRSYKLLPWLY